MLVQTKGFCKYCGKEYTKTGMLRHLEACKRRKLRLSEEHGKRRCKYFQIVLSGKYNKDYWLIIETSEDTTLKELDKFIRDIWVECCNHLSVFTIEGIEYESVPNTSSFWGTSSNNMNYRLKDVCKVGTTMSYEYDFGSTTELVLKIQSVREGEKKNNEIVILSRNNPLEILCSHCEKNRAIWVNPQRYYDGDPFWCKECLCEVEDCEEEDLEYFAWDTWSNVCNSPRMGICGYEGSSIYPDQFIPDEE